MIACCHGDGRGPHRSFINDIRDFLVLAEKLHNSSGQNKQIAAIFFFSYRQSFLLKTVLENNSSFAVCLSCLKKNIAYLSSIIPENKIYPTGFPGNTMLHGIVWLGYKAYCILFSYEITMEHLATFLCELHKASHMHNIFFFELYIYIYSSIYISTTHHMMAQQYRVVLKTHVTFTQLDHNWFR